MKPKLLSVVFVSTWCILPLAGPSTASSQNLYLQSGFVEWAPGASNALFSLTFNHVPDFASTDQFGRQADSFQFYIGSTNGLGPYTSLIRGGEIYMANDIRIRNQAPPDLEDPASAGWGTIRGIVPYTLNGQTLTFSVPLDVLNASGSFSFSLQLGEYGSWTGLTYFGKAGGPIITMWAPRLQISRLGDSQVRLSWPTNDTRYRLQFAPQLPATRWDAVTNQAVIVGDHYHVTLDGIASRGFHRLSKP